MRESSRVALFDVPAEVVSVFRQFRTAEFTTIGKDGTPATWPTTVVYHPDRCGFVTTTSIGLPQKAVNIRRNPRVALLFSEPRASSLQNPPAVLVQGEARADEELTSIDGVEDVWEKVYRFQRSAKQISLGPLMKRLMGWYYIRIAIHVAPTRMLWWPKADFTTPPLEVLRVG
jgi:hypothetical protein